MIDQAHHSSSLLLTAAELTHSKCRSSFRALCAVCGLLVTFVDAGLAQTAPQLTPRQVRRGFERLDTNDDGKLSLAEASDKAAFQNMDANSDGHVTLPEARAYFRSRGEAATPRTNDNQPPAVVPDEKSMAAKRQLLAKTRRTENVEQRPPNIVLILADDLGYADTQAYGGKTIPTPHIDSLAAGGMRFTDAYVTAASCSPSRAGLISGRYQQRVGFEFNTSNAQITHRASRGLDPGVITLTDVLQQAGYATGMFGKWHLGTREYFHPMQRGFDEFFGFLAGAHSYFPAKAKQPVYSTIMRGDSPLIEPEYLTDAFARETVRFIDEQKDLPFFAYVSMNAVHTPLEASQKYLDRFPKESNDKQRAFNAMTSALDDAVGDIMQSLKDHKLDDKTLVIFLSDNGGPIYTGVQSNKPLRLGKLFLFEGGIRVPMIARWPGQLRPGGEFRRLASSLDIFPTVCAAAGIALPPELALDGVNLLPYLTGSNDSSPHEALFWSNGPNKAVRRGPWKLIQSGDHVWLFNLDKDIGETRNLATENPEIARQLEQALEQWQNQMPEPAWPSKPNRQIIDIDGVPYQLNI